MHLVKYCYNIGHDLVLLCLCLVQYLYKVLQDSPRYERLLQLSMIVLIIAACSLLHIYLKNSLTSPVRI